MASQEVKYKKWFDETLKLPQYYEKFIEEGYDDMSYLFEFDLEDGDQELKNIGITKKPHRRRILKEIKKLIDNEIQQPKEKSPAKKEYTDSNKPSPSISDTTIVPIDSHMIYLLTPFKSNHVKVQIKSISDGMSMYVTHERKSIYIHKYYIFDRI